MVTYVHSWSRCKMHLTRKIAKWQNYKKWNHYTMWYVLCHWNLFVIYTVHCVRTSSVKDFPSERMPMSMYYCYFYKLNKCFTALLDGIFLVHIYKFYITGNSLFTIFIIKCLCYYVSDFMFSKIFHSPSLPTTFVSFSNFCKWCVTLCAAAGQRFFGVS